VVRIHAGADGPIDHFLVRCVPAIRRTMNSGALDRLNAIWQRDGRPELAFTPVEWNAGGRPLALKDRNAVHSSPHWPRRAVGTGKREEGYGLSIRIRFSEPVLRRWPGLWVATSASVSLNGRQVIPFAL